MSKVKIRRRRPKSKDKFKVLFLFLSRFIALSTPMIFSCNHIKLQFVVFFFLSTQKRFSL